MPEAPVLRVSEDEQYTQVAVVRGDVVVTEVVTCKYQPANEEVLRFELDDEVITQVHVEVGENVKAGDLLVELENTQLSRQIEAQQETLDSLNLQITQTDEKLKLYYVRCATLEEAGYSTESADRTCLQLYNELEYLKKLLTVEQMAMDELQAEMSLRQIRASMDGTVRSVVDVKEGIEKKSTENATACIVSDLSSGNFTARTNAGLFKKGQKVTINYNSADHEATVAEITPVDNEKGEEDVVFQLDIPDAAIDTNVSGTITVITGESRDTLYLPSYAVNTRDNVSLVYYLDENGIRNSKQVEIGLVGIGVVEIKSGLEEGEMVIKWKK